MPYKKVQQCLLCERIMHPKDRKHNNLIGASIPIKVIDPCHSHYKEFSLHCDFGRDYVLNSRLCKLCKRSIVDYFLGRSGIREHIEFLRLYRRTDKGLVCVNCFSMELDV